MSGLDKNKKKDELKIREIILRLMRRNSRQRLIGICMQENLSVEQAFNEYYKMKSSVIIKNCSLINYELTRFKHRYLIIVEFKSCVNSLVDLSLSERMMVDYLNIHPNINSISLAENGLIIDSIFKSKSSCDELLLRIKEFDVLGLSSYRISDEICREEFYK